MHVVSHSNRPQTQGSVAKVVTLVKRLFCHHQWSPSRSQPDTVVCYKCRARRPQQG